MPAAPFRISRATNEDCHLAAGVVVAIDVLRAFTTAACAFAAGASELIAVSSVADAFSLRRLYPDALLMGEVAGQSIDGFDFGNSPVALLHEDLSGKRLIQRTSAGTQGLVRSVAAQHLFAASLVCATATARHLARIGGLITLVATGVYLGRDGDEDHACADYIEALLSGMSTDRASLVQRVRDSHAGQQFDGTDPASLQDLELCCDIDRFDFALHVERHGGLLVMRTLG
jgi:2-phosphosulfolactate phosphatase